tara:strand:+ start:91 stop:519 length:429 start_codon:yes stop_codon:yes gene_type:complete
MKRLFLIVGLSVMSCSDLNPTASENCECGLEISSTLPYNNGSYKLEYNKNLSQTYTMLDATTACGWSQHLLWDTNYQYLINTDWVSLVNPASMSDEDGESHVMFAVWEEFIGLTITVYCGYTDDNGHHLLDSLKIKVINEES